MEDWSRFSGRLSIMNQTDSEAWNVVRAVAREEDSS